MKRLVCLLYAVGIIGCGNPQPEMPPYAGSDEYGVSYFFDDGLNITVETASKQMRLTVEALGGDIGRMRGLSIGYTARSFDCGTAVDAAGCYYRSDPPSIIVHSYHKACPYLSVLAHETWHHLVTMREPDLAEETLIQHVNQKVLLEMLKECPEER